MSKTSFSEVVGRKVLIMGDVGTGKTALTRRILREALQKGLREEITVIEMAPRSITRKGMLVGGKLIDGEDLGVRILDAGDIKTPRLSARSAEELLRLADHNKFEIEKQITKFSENPTDVVFVNDASIYLQRGDVELLRSAMSKAQTVVANGYYGKKLREDFGTGLSARERRMMEELASRMEVMIRL